MNNNNSNKNSVGKELADNLNNLNLNSQNNQETNTSFKQIPITQTNSYDNPFLSSAIQNSFNYSDDNQFSQQVPNFQQEIDIGFAPQMQSQYSNNIFQNVSNLSTIPNTLCYSEQIIENLKKLNQGDDETLPVLSVIVTLHSGSSYDDLFRSVKQVAPEGRVSLYSASLESTDLLLSAIKGQLDEITNEECKKVAKELLKDIESVEPDCVLFNWECCSSCGASFPQKQKTMQLLKLLMEKHFMAMFSDFALKSLISDWDVELLGLNPFIRLGDCSSFINLKFKPDVLKECPSSQLKMVGQLCEKGEASLHALSSTIVFTVDNTKVDASRYQLEILTIATETGGFKIGSQNNLHEIDGKKGAVGHAMIKFNNGGIIIVSAGHWIELSKLDVNVVNLEKAAEILGGNFSEQFNCIKKSNQSEYQKSMQYNQMANQFVMQSAPCNYSQKVQKAPKK